MHLFDTNQLTQGSTNQIEEKEANMMFKRFDKLKGNGVTTLNFDGYASASYFVYIYGSEIGV